MEVCLILPGTHGTTCHTVYPEVSLSEGGAYGAFVRLIDANVMAYFEPRPGMPLGQEWGRKDGRHAKTYLPKLSPSKVLTLS